MSCESDDARAQFWRTSKEFFRRIKYYKGFFVVFNEVQGTYTVVGGYEHFTIVCVMPIQRHNGGAMGLPQTK